MLTITESAQSYLLELLSKQKDDVLGIRVFINSPGTMQAETCISYCREENIQDDDEKKLFGELPVWLDALSITYLEDGIIDYAKDRMGGQLTIKAPNAKMPKVSENSPIEDRINYVIYYDINPQLASHGGDVSLIGVTDDMIAMLNFGGGCTGCAAVDVTLKHGVEKVLLEKVPELKGVNDMTDHSDNTNAYYK